MKNQSNGLPRSQVFTAESDNGTIESNTLARTTRRGFSSHLLSNMNHDSSSSSNIWNGKFISFQSNFTDSLSSQSTFKSIFF